MVKKRREIIVSEVIRRGIPNKQGKRIKPRRNPRRKPKFVRRGPYLYVYTPDGYIYRVNEKKRRKNLRNRISHVKRVVKALECCKGRKSIPYEEASKYRKIAFYNLYYTRCAPMKPDLSGRFYTSGNEESMEIMRILNKITEPKECTDA